MEKAIVEEAGWMVYSGGATPTRRRRPKDESVATRQQRAAELLRRMQPNGWDEV